ncbi:MAG: hypothetical protein OXI96_06285 [Acidimicrobiaceae bacterium]|nr:hypothetical protein [Acidimicrobiaceae bacterium]
MGVVGVMGFGGFVMRLVGLCLVGVLSVGCGSGESDGVGVDELVDEPVTTTTVVGDSGEDVTTTLVPDPTPEVTEPDPVPVTTTTVLGPASVVWSLLHRPEFVVGVAPEWPFRGLVQLWRGVHEYQDVSRGMWVLRFWSWDPTVETHSEVLLPDFGVDCLGGLVLVSHGEVGIEVGGAVGAVDDAFWVDWGGSPRRVEPSEVLLEAAGSRPSNVPVETEGDLVRVGEGLQARSYAMRDPLRSNGQRWDVQARHDGDLFVLSVHPAHLECLSGVTWLSLADTGELVACGANTAATVFVTPEPPDDRGSGGDHSGNDDNGGGLVMPDSEVIGVYLSCPVPLDLESVSLPELKRTN